MDIKIISILAIIYLSGCSAIIKDPWYHDAVDNPETVELKDDAIKQKINYLSRFIMESDDRAEFLSDFNKSELVKRWNAADYAITSEITADLVTGTVNSAEGNTLGSSVFIAGLILGEIFDGSQDYVGQAWLPEMVHGEQLRTKEDADRMLARVVNDKVKNVAEKMRLDAKCIKNCGTRNQIFYLTHKEGTKNPGYIYWPRDVAIMTNVAGMVEANKDDLISAVLEYPVSWKTPGGYTFALAFFGDVILDGEGNPKIKKIKDRDLYLPRARRDLLKTRYGRDIMRHFHGDKYSFFGTSETYPREVIFNGEIYSFIRNGTKDLIKGKIVEKSFSSKVALQ